MSHRRKLLNDLFIFTSVPHLLPDQHTGTGAAAPPTQESFAGILKFYINLSVPLRELPAITSVGWENG